MAIAMLVAGCGKPASPVAKGKEGTQETPAKATVASEKKEVKGDHSGWWCDEHGVPESECSLCSAKVAAEAKKKGDWCDKHDRAKSHCFVCEASLKEKFAARYRAKYGKEPPPVEEESPGEIGK